jgi:hypothetical protein
MELHHYQLSMDVRILHVEPLIQILNEDELGLEYTKVDNEIRALYKAKDTFLPIDRSLFVLPLARILAQNLKTKEVHLIGFKAAQLRLKEAFHDPENLENRVNPANRWTRKPQQKPKTHQPT